jgi:hypothetical protein
MLLASKMRMMRLTMVLKCAHGLLMSPGRRVVARRTLAVGAVNTPAEHELSESERTPNTNTINWYPGHIAKAERALREYLGRVDVVVETRDVRIGLTTAHPLVATWIGVRPKVVVFTFADMVPASTMDDWRKYENSIGNTCYFIDAKRGDQVKEAWFVVVDRPLPT